MRKSRPAEERFWEKVDKSGDCWLWTAYTNSDGYSRFGPAYGHRLSYEMLIGPIPDGKELDHLCRVRHCVNPSHLEPVSHQENVARGSQASKTHCLRGHEYSVENTYRTPIGNRACRSCARDKGHRNRKSKELAAQLEDFQP